MNKDDEINKSKKITIKKKFHFERKKIEVKQVHFIVNERLDLILKQSAALNGWSKSLLLNNMVDFCLKNKDKLGFKVVIL